MMIKCWMLDTCEDHRHVQCCRYHRHHHRRRRRAQPRALSSSSQWSWSPWICECMVTSCCCCWCSIPDAWWPMDGCACSYSFQWFSQCARVLTIYSKSSSRIRPHHHHCLRRRCSRKQENWCNLATANQTNPQRRRGRRRRQVSWAHKLYHLLSSQQETILLLFVFFVDVVVSSRNIIFSCSCTFNKKPSTWFDQPANQPKSVWYIQWGFVETCHSRRFATKEHEDCHSFTLYNHTTYRHFITQHLRQLKDSSEFPLSFEVVANSKFIFLKHIDAHRHLLHSPFGHSPSLNSSIGCTSRDSSMNLVRFDLFSSHRALSGWALFDLFLFDDIYWCHTVAGWSLQDTRAHVDFATATSAIDDGIWFFVLDLIDVDSHQPKLPGQVDQTDLFTSPNWLARERGRLYESGSSSFQFRKDTWNLSPFSQCTFAGQTPNFASNLEACVSKFSVSSPKSSSSTAFL